MPSFRYCFLLTLAIGFSACTHFDRATGEDGIIYSKRAYAAGRGAAHRDLAHGILAMETYGLRRGEMMEDADRIMRERYGITTHSVAGCIVDNSIVGHAKGYNDVTRAEILRRYGPDFFERILHEVERRFYRKHPNAPRE